MEKTEEQLIVEFFELKFLQLLTKVLQKKHFNFAYTGDSIGEMYEDFKYRQHASDVEEKLIAFVMKNQSLLKSKDMHAEAEAHKVSTERQRELSKELLGKEYDVDMIVEIMESM